MLAPRSSSAQFIVVCLMIHEIVGLPGSLYFTGMGQLTTHLCLIQGRPSLGHLFFFSWRTYLLRILHMMGLIYSIKKGHIDLNLFEHFPNLLHLSSSLVIC